MRIPLTRYGLPEVLVYPAVILLLIATVAVLEALLPIWAVVAIEVILLTALIWILAFFRDPYRSVNQLPAACLAAVIRPLNPSGS